MSFSFASSSGWFNPSPTIQRIPLFDGQQAIVIDNVLLEPTKIREIATSVTFVDAPLGTYPGIWSALSTEQTQMFCNYLNQYLKSPIGYRRLLDATVRWSLVTQSPSKLKPSQWQCHQDRVNLDPARIQFLASVLYLFEDNIGGTAFYRPKRSSEEIVTLLNNSQTMDADVFQRTYGVEPGYMLGTNDWFECMTIIPPAFNRMVIYDGSIFHTGHISDPDKLSSKPLIGRLSINGFFTTTRHLVR